MEPDDPIAEQIEDAIWQKVAKAALRVGCSTCQAECWRDMALESCKPLEMRRDWRPNWRDAFIRPQEPDEMRREYRAKLADLLTSLDDTTLEAEMSDLARDEGEWKEELTRKEKGAA